MRKNHWKAVAVAAVLMMTMPAIVALAADKTEKAKPASKTTEQMMPGCTMHGGAEKDADASMPGCGMKGGMGGGMAGGPMHGPGMGPGMAGGPKCGPMLKALDLTAEQQKKVDAIHEKQARVMVQAQADIRIAEMDMQQLVRAETPDKAKIDAQIDKLAQLKAGMQKSRTATLLEIRGLLTPEQQKKFSVGPMMGGEEDD